MTAPHDPIRDTAIGVRIDVRVIPRSPRNAVGGVRDGRIVIRVTSPPVDQAANQTVVEFLAATLRVPRRRIRIVSGEATRNKSIVIEGAPAADVRRHLTPDTDQ